MDLQVAKPELAYGLAKGGQTDLQVGSHHWLMRSYNNRLLVINLCWLALGGQTVKKLRLLAQIWAWPKSTQVVARWCKSTQVGGQTKRKLIASPKLASTCESVWPGLNTVSFISQNSEGVALELSPFEPVKLSWIKTLSFWITILTGRNWNLSLRQSHHLPPWRLLALCYSLGIWAAFPGLWLFDPTFLARRCLSCSQRQMLAPWEPWPDPGVPWWCPLECVNDTH